MKMKTDFMYPAKQKYFLITTLFLFPLLWIGCGTDVFSQNTFSYQIKQGSSAIPPFDGVAGGQPILQVPYDSGYVVFGGAGHTESLDPTDPAFLKNGSGFGITRLDKYGNFAWAKMYYDVPRPADALYHPTALLSDGIITSDSGFVMVGTRGGFFLDGYNPTNGYHTFVQRTDKNGNLLWSKQYDVGNSNIPVDRPRKIFQLPDEGFIVMGETLDAAYSPYGPLTFPAYNTYLLRLDKNGNVTWCYVYDAGGKGTEYPKSLDLCQDGSFIVGGYSYVPDTVVFDANNNPSTPFSPDTYLAHYKGFMMKVSSDGQTVTWARRYGKRRGLTRDFRSLGNEQFEEIKQTTDGGYIAVGQTGDTGAYISSLYEYQGWMVKTDASGKIKWQKTFDTQRHPISKLEELSDGYVFAFGSAYNGDPSIGFNSNGSGRLTRINKTGEVQWSKLYGGDITELNKTMDDGFIMQAGSFLKTNRLGEFSDFDQSCFYEGSLSSRVEERVDTLYPLVPKKISQVPTTSIFHTELSQGGASTAPVPCAISKKPVAPALGIYDVISPCANTVARFSIGVFGYVFSHYKIDFGDPSSGPDNVLTGSSMFDLLAYGHTYASEGTYTVTMVVYNGDYSLSDTAFTRFTVIPPMQLTLTTPEIWICGGDTTIVELSARIDNYYSLVPPYVNLYGHGSSSWWTGSVLSKSQTVAVNEKGETTLNIEASYIADTSLKYIIIDPVGTCLSQDTFNIFSGDNKALVSGNTKICKGGTASLKASGGDSYLWSTGATGAVLKVSPASSATYWVEAKTVDGCRDTAFVYVQVVPEINTEVFAEKKTGCVGDEVKLYATGADNYVWNNGSTTDTIRVILANGQNNFSATGKSGSCSSTASIQILADSLPDPKISGPSFICGGQEYTFTASGGDRYSWQGPLTGPDPTSEIQHFKVESNTASFNIWLTAFNGVCGATITKSFPEMLSSPNIAGIDVSQGRVCPGTQVTLRKYFPGYAFRRDFPYTIYYDLENDPENQNLTYQWSNGATGAGANDSIKITVTRDTTVSLTTTNGYGCSSTVSTAIEARPSFYIKKEGSPTPTCATSPSTLFLMGVPLFEFDYTWKHNGSNEDTLVVSPLQDTFYVVTAVANGCSRTDSIWVEAKSNLPEALVHGDSIVCQGVAGTYTASGEIAATGYEWLSGNPADVLPSFTTFLSKDTSIRVVVSFTGGCSDTAEYQVSVIDKPKALITGDTLLCAGGTTLLDASGGYVYGWSTGSTGSRLSLTPSNGQTISLYAFAGNCSDTAMVTIRTDQSITASLFADEDTVCSGTPLTLIAGGGDDYAWNTGEKGEMLGILPALTTTYAVNVTTGDNCSDTESITINVIASPTLSVSGPGSICSGESAVLNAVGSVADFLWSTGDSAASITVMPGNDSIFYVASFSEGCTDSVGHTVTVIPSTSISAGADQTVLPGTDVTLAATGGSNYNWSTADSLLCDNCNSLVIQPTKTTTYYVTETNSPCAEDSVTIYVLSCTELFVPTAFSPNGDGVNDVLYVKNDCIKDLDFSIYDRWGNRVFYTVNATDGWNGTYKDKLLNSQVLVYYVRATLLSGEPISGKGNISLIR